MFVDIGPGGWLYQIDFEKAYRMIPIHPMDWAFLGIQAGGRHAVDTRLVFGAGEAPLEFTSFADCLMWDLQQNCGLRWLEHYLDDFVGGEKTEEKARLAMQIAITELRIMGVTLNENKIKMGQELTILGIEVNMKTMTVSVPKKKVERLCKKLDDLLQEDKGVSLKELRSLVGMLATCAMVMRQGRVYTQELYSTLAEAERTRKGPNHFSAGMKAELQWWRENLVKGNATQLMLDEKWAKMETTPFSDASSTYGMGGVFRGTAWQHEWTKAEKGLMKRNKEDVAKIAIGEMKGTLTSAVLFGASWRGKLVEFRCDNTTVCSAVNSGRCKFKKVQEMVKWLASFSCSNNFHIYLRYVPTECNTDSDILSRQLVSGQEPRWTNWCLIPKKDVDLAVKAGPRWTD
jgi:hypothetical protein